jgi:hypothetical protein
MKSKNLIWLKLTNGDTIIGELVDDHENQQNSFDSKVLSQDNTIRMKNILTFMFDDGNFYMGQWIFGSDATSHAIIKSDSILAELDITGSEDTIIELYNYTLGQIKDVHSQLKKEEKMVESNKIIRMPTKGNIH